MLSFPLEEAGEWGDGGRQAGRRQTTRRDRSGRAARRAGRAAAPARRRRRLRRVRRRARPPPTALPRSLRAGRAAGARAAPSARLGPRERRRPDGAAPGRAARASFDWRHPWLTAAEHGLLKSFNYAFSGIVYALRHERNMQIHFGIADRRAGRGAVLRASRVEELLLVFVAITFVIIAEMINTAIEYTVDMVTDEDDPTAKIAKDVAAGAVFIAAAQRARGRLPGLLRQDRQRAVHGSHQAARLAHRRHGGRPASWSIIVAVVVKASVGKRHRLARRLAVGHAAVAFAAWVAVTVRGHQHGVRHCRSAPSPSSWPCCRPRAACRPASTSRSR